ncbi:TIGR04282 family arsenosugar biosynthesis glycosyltransferase [Psychroflexus tropicus]|uniref:TIGR04282 family arsenosugar biosynthesis glycosyltransferase n=1 Tax=Psychroflexus tropicus TaxID=197345 RepID=UPI000378D6DF|nr:TIGR04282 family arsenosugar biosynthesis glycosyltransferase [Psychroflexus tropicus]
MHKLVIVFAKNPELGKCKTRLAKSIGDEKALEVYKTLLKHTAETLAQVEADRVVFYSETIQHHDLWGEDVFQKQVQIQGHLGEKMQAAFEWGFAQGYSEICIVGSDLMELKVTDLDQAFMELEAHDLVFGPAQDGGFYLMGMTQLYKRAFLDKAWSTETVLKDTLKDLKGLKYALLETKTDIDYVENALQHQDLKAIIEGKIVE